MSKISGFFRKVVLAVCPVKREELLKVLSMSLFLFFLCNCYSILRNVKDAALLTAQGSGAETLPFIKVWGVLPGAFLGTWIYTKLCNRFTRENVVYIIISSFLLYFLAFALYIYPHHQEFYLGRFHQFFSNILPTGFQGLIALFSNWVFTIFYVICELWSVLILTITFWGFANEVNNVSEAKRLYGILNVSSTIAPIVGGGIALFLTKYLPLPAFISYGDEWSDTLIKLTLLVTVMGVASMGIFYWINRRVIPGNNWTALINHSTTGIKKKKKAISMRESFKTLLGSKYLLSVAVIVLSFGLAINLTDVLWKDQLKKFYSDPTAMVSHMNKITIGIGVVGTASGLLFATLIRRIGWTGVAILTPLTMTILGVGFFAFLFAGDALGGFSMLFGMAPMALTVYFGSMQNCLSKALKYSSFDITKEMAFLPLGSEEKLKGKAAIDGLGSGMGKSGSSLIYQGFILVYGSIALSAPYIAGLLMLVFVGWIVSVIYVGKSFKTLSGESESTQEFSPQTT